MIFTIGHKESYEQYFREFECPKKKGRTSNYVGGSVWRTYSDARSACKRTGEDYDVYGVMARWNLETIQSEQGDWHDLLVDSPLRQLRVNCCNCRSHNWEVGEVPEVIVPAPPHMAHKESYCIDACIVNVIKHLWDKGVVTLSSCCGHGVVPASVVIGENENGMWVREFIHRVDKRDWEVRQWRKWNLNSVRPSDRDWVLDIVAPVSWEAMAWSIDKTGKRDV